MVCRALANAEDGSLSSCNYFFEKQLSPVQMKTDMGMKGSILLLGHRIVVFKANLQASPIYVLYYTVLR